jgi:hypothetical protein
MPIVGRTLREAARTFCDQLNRVLAKTVTQTRLVEFGLPDAPTTAATFRQAGNPTEARLRTRYGPMGLYIGQLCGSVPTPDKQHRLVTVEYRYTLTPAGANAPLFRWEYIRTPKAEEVWCRHHLQGTVPISIGQHTIPLNEWHLPTGYVPIEDILRFCIVDLGVAPLSDDWDTVLRDSYERFKTEFAR